MSFLCRSAIGAAWIGVVAVPLDAQTFESVGTRAQGMGGAFVAVADDATASWWNPAGLAAGAYVNVVFEHGRMTEPESPSGLTPAARAQSSGFAAAFPALGVSYYRLHISEIRPVGSTDTTGASRQDQGVIGVGVRALSVSQFGVTVGQSIGDHLVIGSTLKLVRGGIASGAALASEDPLGAADALRVSRRTRGDIDIGAMASLGRLRLGLSVKNVTEPDLGSDDESAKLGRQARVGVAFLTPARGSLHALAVAVDADLTRTSSVFGDVRHVAGGAEAWLSKRRLGIRGGVTANTVGDLRPALSGGLSLAALKGVYLDAAVVSGSDKTRKAWSTTVRLTF